MPVEGQILIDKYRLDCFVGSGGFASVWAATNIIIDRPVALKILADTLSRKPKVVARFLQEAKLASRSIHPVIVRVEDLGQTSEGTPFLVMELLEGRTLDDELIEQPHLELSKGLEIMRLILEGLSAAHQQGIIHRDIKPSNIFLSPSSRSGPKVRILDFGLAKDLDSDEGFTQTGAMMGTPDYLSPEVLLSTERTRWSAKADVFACGMVLFNMLTGQFPIKPSNNSVGGALKFAERAAYYRSSTSLPGPSELSSEVPTSIDAVNRKALSIDPRERYQDASEMLADLNKALETSKTTAIVAEPGSRQSQPVPALIASPEHEELKETRRGHPAIWAAVGAIGAIAIVGFLFLILPSRPIVEGLESQNMDPGKAERDASLQTEAGPAVVPVSGLPEPSSEGSPTAGTKETTGEIDGPRRSTKGPSKNATPRKAGIGPRPLVKGTYVD